MLRYIIILSLLTFCTSCQKYLDVKPDKSLVVPTTVADLRALLNNTSIMNGGYPVIQEGATDNSFVLPNTWQSLTSVTAKNMYIWDNDIFNDGERNEWSMRYIIINYCNLILEQLVKINPLPSERNQIMGEALFFRSLAFFQLADLFSKPFNKNNAETDIGIPIRLQADINEKSTRSSMAETYNQIIEDLEQAALLLPAQGVYKTTPTKPAVYGLLARIYLSMEDYENALLSADSCLKFSNTLLDYNELIMGSPTSYPVPRYNEEVIFHTTAFGRPILNVTNGRVGNELYDLYEDSDVRKNAFYRDRTGTYSFRGSYDGSSVLFTGISTNEIYLIKAECEARLGRLPNALESINKLLENRYDASFVSYDTDDQEAALRFVLDERRKELVFRGIRWSDLRRLNNDPRFTKTITRDINGTIYTLEPNSPKYVLPLPNSVIINNAIEQNER